MKRQEDRLRLEDPIEEARQQFKENTAIGVMKLMGDPLVIGFTAIGLAAAASMFFKGKQTENIPEQPGVESTYEDIRPT